ncbi:MAG TPA: RNA 2',3'-cyclic phosphodiesterase [Synergistales bacterium]|jgi:2'-5' RNA ligase|nr:RNA 2',3'-cyclic phosphodiesterase [Synergistales bacterium]HOR54802.1 RNA 2',3'-cyclic phosphodiesterase [Synergistales bacterium]HPK42249.1 RNA 2',3'-cyclic phosphodiesterase [Synergistales bacterium]
MPGDLVRCFVCVQLGGAVKEKLSRWVSPFRKMMPELRWVKEDAYHITLKFCGEIPYTLLYKLESALEHGLSLKKTRPFPLELAGIGAFPGFRQPRVLWAGIGGEDYLVQRLAAVAERAAVAAGIEREKRPFHPHVTLARIPPGADLPVGALREMNSSSESWGEWTVSSLTLMRSDLLPEGPRYSPIAVFEFSNDLEVQ